ARPTFECMSAQAAAQAAATTTTRTGYKERLVVNCTGPRVGRDAERPPDPTSHVLLKKNRPSATPATRVTSATWRPLARSTGSATTAPTAAPITTASGNR